MTGPPPSALREAEALSQRLSEWPDEPGALWRITGPPTSGKSTLLRLLAEKIDRSILISPPPRAADSPQVGLLQLYGGLKDRCGANGELEGIIEPRGTWADKLDLLRSWLKENGQGVVLLCDDPMDWVAEEHKESYFADCASSLIYLLLEDPPCHRIVTGALPEGIRYHQRLYLEPSSDPQAWLNDADSWGRLADVARTLWNQYGANLTEFTPVDLRLIVAFNAVAQATGLPSYDPYLARSRRAHSASFAQLLAQDDRWRDLRLSWARLALLRLPFEDPYLEQFGLEHLDDFAADVLKRCLLFPEGKQWILHDMLRNDALEKSWLSTDEARRLHQAMAERYAEDFKADHDLRSRLAYEAEAFYHSCTSGDLHASDKYRVFFVQQLNMLGRILSLDIGDVESAAEVFRRSLAWDADDPYAHHYLAYNLDWMARQPIEVEEHYRKAIQLQPRHAWWHSRWICFLIARGRTRDAQRAWDEALDYVGSGRASSQDPGLYRHLHRWVAAVLLHRGELVFAASVLGAVPRQLLDEEPEFRGLERLLEALIDVEQHGAYTPASYMLRSQQWWKDGPFLLEPELRQGYTLVRWFAGRVDGRDGDELLFRVADIKHAEGGPTIEYSMLTIALSKLDEWTFDGNVDQFTVGRFFELGIYKDAKGHTQRRILIHRGRRWSDVDVLPPLKPDPERYLRA